MNIKTTGTGYILLQIYNSFFEFRDSAHSSIQVVGNQDGSNFVEANTWSHIAFIYDKGSWFVYINGQYNAEKSYIASTPAIFKYNNSATNWVKVGHVNTTSSDTYYNGNMNDFRFYDHALSAKEVEELSRGLILHYTLNNNINNIIYDTSGYNNHAQIIGSTSLDLTSPRYSNSIFMDNQNTTNRIEIIEPLSIPDDNKLSVSFWVKLKKDRGHIIFAIPKILQFAINTTATYCWISPTSAPGYSLSSFKDDAWNHIVAIRDNNTFLLYINGIQITANGSNNNWGHTSTKTYLLNRNTNTTYAATASISDFRIYTTILTEAQIKELYNTTVTVDKIGNVYCRENIEQDNQLLINKKGQYIVNTVKEIDNNQAYMSHNNKLNCNHIYEY